MWGCEVEKEAPTACFQEPIWNQFPEASRAAGMVLLKAIESLVELRALEPLILRLPDWSLHQNPRHYRFSIT